MRGGSWNNDTNNVRAANRNRNTPDNRNDNVGFRCARSLSPGQNSAGLAFEGRLDLSSVP